MNDYRIAGAALVAFGVVIWGAALLANWRVKTHRRLVSTEALVEAYRNRAIHYETLYREKVATNAALLEHIGDERQAQAHEALAENAIYFAAKAAREAKRLDYELFELLEDDES